MIPSMTKAARLGLTAGGLGRYQTLRDPSGRSAWDAPLASPAPLISFGSFGASLIAPLIHGPRLSGPLEVWGYQRSDPKGSGADVGSGVVVVIARTSPGSPTLPPSPLHSYRQVGDYGHSGFPVEVRSEYVRKVESSQ